MKNLIAFIITLVTIISVSINFNIKSQAKDVELLNDVIFIRDEQKLSTIKIDINNYKTEKSSMAIKVPNISLDSVNDTRQITNEQKEWLIENGYTGSVKKLDTRNDFLNEKAKMLIRDKETIMHIQEIYPELAKVDLTKWTYEKFMSYSKENDKKTKYFTDDEKTKLQSRGLTVSDAIIMLKEYNSFDNIINLSDKEIIKALEKYYNDKLLFAKYVKYAGDLYLKKGINIENALNSKEYVNGSYEYGDSISDYDSVIVPGYNYGKADLFLKTTRTSYGDNNITAAAATQKIWSLVYRPNGVTTRDMYYATNLWGTRSSSNSQAHEGLDLPSKPTHYVDTYAIMGSSISGYIATGNMINLNDNMGTACYYINYSHYPYTVFHMHSTDHSTGYVLNGDKVSEEGGVGGFDPHLHFSVNTGYNTTYGLYHGDGGLTSNNPYTFISRHSNGTYSWD